MPVTLRFFFSTGNNKKPRIWKPASCLSVAQLACFTARSIRTVGTRRHLRTALSKGSILDCNVCVGLLKSSEMPDVTRSGGRNVCRRDSCAFRPSGSTTTAPVPPTNDNQRGEVSCSRAGHFCHFSTSVSAESASRVDCAQRRKCQCNVLSTTWRGQDSGREVAFLSAWIPITASGWRRRAGQYPRRQSLFSQT